MSKKLIGICTICEWQFTMSVRDLVTIQDLRILNEALETHADLEHETEQSQHFVAIGGRND